MLQQKRNLEQLQNSAEFLARHIGPSPDDQQQMLHALDCSNLQQLIEQVVPKSIATSEPLPFRTAVLRLKHWPNSATLPSKISYIKILLGRVIMDAYTHRYSAQYTGKSSVVYSLYPLSARDLPRSLRGAV